MSDPSRSTAKSALRRGMRLRMRAMPAPPQDLHAPLAAWLERRGNLRVVAIFAPLPGEPDLLPLTKCLPAIRWCFPRITANERMSFHPVAAAPGDLQAGAFGILEPSPDAPEMAMDRIDAFLCPGLAFDLLGGRLGKGRGFYDKALSAARSDAIKIGACFAFQIVPTTFPEAHDVPMDLLACEDGILTIPAARA